MQRRGMVWSVCYGIEGRARGYKAINGVVNADYAESQLALAIHLIFVLHFITSE